MQFLHAGHGHGSVKSMTIINLFSWNEKCTRRLVRFRFVTGGRDRKHNSRFHFGSLEASYQFRAT